MKVQVAAAAGNVFGYLSHDEFNYESMADLTKILCRRGYGFGLDGLFLMQRPGSGEWILDHWDPDGTKTFCSNGSRAALAIPGAPSGASIDLRSTEVPVTVVRMTDSVGIRMPEGGACRLQDVPVPMTHPAAFGWIGNPQLVVRVADTTAVHLPTFAPPLRHHPGFPEGTNVNVVQVTAPGIARIRSWERGVEGETLCCGTGCAVAAAWLAQSEGVLDWCFETAGGDTVRVSLGGFEGTAWRELWLSGAVKYLGEIHPDPSLLQALRS